MALRGLGSPHDGRQRDQRERRYAPIRTPTSACTGWVKSIEPTLKAYNLFSLLTSVMSNISD